MSKSVPDVIENLADDIRRDLQLAACSIGRAAAMLLVARTLITPDAWDRWQRENFGEVCDLLSDQLGRSPDLGIRPQIH